MTEMKEITILDAIENAAIEMGKIYCLSCVQEIDAIIREHIGKLAPSGALSADRDKRCAEFLLPIHRYKTYCKPIVVEDE